MVAEHCGVDNRRTISSVKLEDERQRTAHATEYVVKAEAELPEVRDGILEALDEDLISLASTGEMTALYSKMKGDYYRYAERVVAIPVPQIMEEIMEVIRLVSQERIHERIVEETIDVPVSRVMEETIEVEKLNGSCAAQAQEWKELRGPRDEELVTIHDNNKLLNDCDELILKWLNLVKDVVDSEDLPLNVYRETLQQNKLLRVIKMNLAKKYPEMLAEIAEKKDDDYKKFYEQFGKRLKLGIHRNFVDGVEIAELLRFNTSKPGDEQISFKEYVDRMKEGQNDIRYITDESIAVVSSSSLGEYLHEKGHEVLHMADPVDEYTVHQPKEFDGTKPNDNDNLELFKETLPSPSVMQVQSDRKRVVRRARALVRKSSRSPGMDLISMATGIGRAQDEGTSLATDIKSHANAVAGPTEQQQHWHNNQQQSTRQAKQQQVGERGREGGPGEEREKGREGERGKDAEEEECKQVEKDATGWTVVTRNKRQRKMAQIFVKVNGSKAIRWRWT